MTTLENLRNEQKVIIDNMETLTDTRKLVDTMQAEIALLEKLLKK